MLQPDPTDFTLLLQAWRGGDEEAGAQMMTAVYQELRRLARHYLRQEHPGHTLQPTALVHELYLRLFGREPVELDCRAHFLVVAAQGMRRILVDHARAKQAEKRDYHRGKLSLEEAAGIAQASGPDLVALDEALARLEAVEPRASRVVELRFFAGLTEKEAAEALGVSLATLKRDWTIARVWLFGQFGRPDA